MRDSTLECSDPRISSGSRASTFWQQGFQPQSMEQILGQLGELLLSAIPTAVLLVLLYAFYHVVVYKPLERVLAERHDKTEGAIQKARADIAAAEAKTAEYEQRLREAKVALFKAQESRRAQAQQVRSRMVTDARSAAEAKIAAAKAAIQGDADAAKAALSVESEQLANEIVSSLLRPAKQAQNSVRGGLQ